MVPSHFAPVAAVLIGLSLVTSTAFSPCEHDKNAPSRSPLGWPITSLAAVSWADLALDYETRVEPVTSSFIDEMIEPLGVSDVGINETNYRKPRFLDIGCGTGSASIYLAEAGYSVTAIDNSPAMIGRLLERCEMLGDVGISCQVADGQYLPSELSNAFDYAISAFSIIFFPDPLAGIKEMHRCLRPGGAAVVSGWGDRGDSPAFRIVPEAVRSVAPELVALSSKDKPFIRSAEVIANQMSKAGFVDIEIKEGIKRTLTIASPEEYYQRFALGSPPTRNMMEWMNENMGEAVVSRFRDAVMRLAVERGGGRTDGPIEIISPAYFVYGVKPMKL